MGIPRTLPATRKADDRKAARSLSGVVAQLTFTNVLVIGLGLVTGTLLARALGPTGRGNLAAILVPFTLAPWILGLGLPAFAGKAAAQGRSLPALIGSVGGLAVLLGLVGTALAEPIATALAEGRETVHVWLLVGLMTLPVWIVSGVLLTVANGLERWKHVIAARIAAPAVTVIGLGILYPLGELTVATAAAVTMCGALCSFLVVSDVARGTGRPVVVVSVAREALQFGAKAWAVEFASIANHRLDQLVMIPLVKPRELGLYAVAVSVSGFGSILTGAVSSALLPPVARGDRAVAARALRRTLTLIATASTLVAGAAPWLLPGIFGSGFSDATPMTWILLVAGIPAAGIFVLATSLINADKPGVAATGEAIGLLITFPGLLLLVPAWGGIGAATVSLAAYTANFTFLLAASKRRFGRPLTEFILPQRADVVWMIDLVRSSRLVIWLRQMPARSS